MNDREKRSTPSENSPQKTVTAPEGLLAQAGLQVAAVDVEQMRSVVASRLFGTAAEPVKIGRFTVLRRVGAGAMGVVYAAYDEKLDRKVAIKVLHGSTVDDVNYTRLMREAQALAKVSHPNVIQIYEVSTFRDQVVLAMEFVEGKSLRGHTFDPKQSLRSRLLPWIEAGRGLAAAHAAGLVHRDFKPDNLLWGADGRVRVVDFGLAGVVQMGGHISGVDLGEERIHDTDEAVIRRSSKQDSFEESLTETGVLMGTPAYMSPEQHRGERADARSDQFSFCVCVWESLYGERPFPGDSREKLALATMEGQFHIRESPSSARVPLWLRRVLMRGLQANPSNRYPDMTVLLLELDRDRKSRAWRWGTSVSLLGILGAGLWWSQPMQQDLCQGGEQPLIGVWDQKTRSSLRHVFMASQLPFAEASFNGTAQALDRYSEQWVDIHRKVCQASVANIGSSPDVLGQQMICLGQGLTAVRQFLNLLQHAGAESMGRATEASSDLPMLERCLKSSSERNPYGEVDAQQRVEIDELLARAENQLALWQFTEGEKAARAAVKLAEEINYFPGQAHALAVLGELLGRLRQLEEAKPVLEQAIRSSDVVRDDFLRVRASISLLGIFRMLGEFEQAELMAQNVMAMLEREGKPRVLEAKLFDEKGMLARIQGKFCSSVRHFERALQLRRQIYGDEKIEVGTTLANFGSALQQAGRMEEAIENHTQSVEIFERTLGKDHPSVSKILVNLGNDFSELGRVTEHVSPAEAQQRYVEAEEFHRRALSIQVRNFGSSHILVAGYLQNLGETLRRQTKFAEAMEVNQAALEIVRKHENFSPIRLAVLLGSLAGSQFGLGQYSSARENLNAARKLCTKCLDRSPEYLGEILFALARVVEAEVAEGTRTNPEPDLQIQESMTIANLAKEAYQKAVDRSGSDDHENCGDRIPGSYAGELAQVQAWIEKRSPEAE